jgi:cytochrome c-type biogenesis protein
MMGDGAVGPLIAFTGGLLSFLSPCVLPLVPSYLGFLTGMTLDEMTDRKHHAVLHALLFVSGFTLVFVIMGAGATALGATVTYNKLAIAKVGGVLVLAFGLYTMGVVRIPALDRDSRMHLDRKPLGFLGSVLVGMAFAAGWTPCIGPILGTILGLAGTSGDVTQGVALLLAYSAGLAVPFLIAAFAVDKFRVWFTRFRRWMPWLQRASGLVLVIVGLLLVTGEFTRLAAMLSAMTPEWLSERL